MAGLLLAAIGGYSIGEIAIGVLVFLAIVAIVIVATRAMGVPIPQWVWTVIGIVVILVVCIVAIRFIQTL